MCDRCLTADGSRLRLPCGCVAVPGCANMTGGTCHLCGHYLGAPISAT